MKVEVLFILVIVLVVLAWYLWDNLSRKKLLKNYNQNDNQSKKPEGKFRAFRRGGEQSFEKSDDAAGGSAETSRGGLLETAIANAVRGDSDLNRKASGNNRNGSLAALVRAIKERRAKKGVAK